MVRKWILENSIELSWSILYIQVSHVDRKIIQEGVITQLDTRARWAKKFQEPLPESGYV
jgi:hypothetical protein